MKNLKTLRKKHGYSQKELADRLEITQQAVSLYEAGKRQADYETLALFAEFFNCSTDYLLGIEDNKKSPLIESDLSNKEKLLLDLYRKLESKDQTMAFAILKSIDKTTNEK